MSETASQKFFYPVVKDPTGRVQFRLDRAEVVTIERIGDVHRGEVVSVTKAGKEPTAKALDFCRGLVVTGNFSHVAADTPLGVPENIGPTEPRERGAAPPPRAAVQFAPPLEVFDPLTRSEVDFDFNSEPPHATLSPMEESAPASTKKSSK